MSFGVHIPADSRASVLDYFESKASRPEFFAKCAEHYRKPQHVGREVARKARGNNRHRQETPALVAEMVRTRALGLSWNQLAARFGMGRLRVQAILRAKGIS